jgi:hypothetical protein
VTKKREILATFQKTSFAQASLLLHDEQARGEWYRVRSSLDKWQNCGARLTKDKVNAFTFEHPDSGFGSCHFRHN